MTSNIRRATNVEPQVLIAQVVNSLTSAAVYSCPADTSVKIATATVCNISATTSSAAYVGIRKGSDNTPWRIANIELRPLESAIVHELVGVLLGPGDDITIAGAHTNLVEFVVSAVVSS